MRRGHCSDRSGGCWIVLFLPSFLATPNCRVATTCRGNAWAGGSTLNWRGIDGDKSLVQARFYHAKPARQIEAACCVRRPVHRSLATWDEVGSLLRGLVREIFRTIRLALGVQFVPPNIFPDRANVSVGTPSSCFSKTSRSHGFFVRPMEYFCRSDR